MMDYYAAKALKRGIPDYMAVGLERWIEYGKNPGSFLTAVLTNDLREACLTADDTNRDLLWNYIAFLYEDAPYNCWGSSEKVKAWQKARSAPPTSGR
jgi:hypothetical protein